MFKTRSVLSLGLLCLTLAGCAAVPVAKVHLPEPSLPACLIEETPGEGHAVGRYEFESGFLARVESLARQNIAGGAAQAALECASDTAKALRESIGVIRTFNLPK